MDRRSGIQPDLDRLHVPCVTVPAGAGPDGLPLGIQIVTRIGRGPAGAGLGAMGRGGDCLRSEQPLGSSVGRLDRLDQLQVDRTNVRVSRIDVAAGMSRALEAGEESKQFDTEFHKVHTEFH